MSSHYDLPTDILVVDDDDSNLLAIEVALGDLGRRLVKARSGREALKHLLRQDFSLILLDVQMPGLDGFETAQLIRARRRSSHVPIIFVTAYTRTDADVLRGYGLGAVDFLFKPIVPEILRAKAAVFVQLQERTEEVRRTADQLRNLERLEHERRLAQERQAVESELLREESRRKDEFLAMLAHELRNPLAPLVTGLELMKMTGLDDPLLARARASMERQVSHLTRLVDDLLEVSRITQGKITLQRAHIDLRELVEQALDSLRRAVDEHGHALSVEKPDEPLPVVGDPVRLTQVFANLVSNAIRYTDRGGNIRVVVEGGEGDVIVRVADDGRGIAPEMLDRIFDLFVQERDGGNGLGLGLTLVHQLVEMHGGCVTARSDGPGHGSEFVVRLPLDPEPPAEAFADRETGETPVPLEPLRVLVIEDEPDIRDTVRALLEGWMHHVEVATDGAAGLERILESRPDVALIDIGLPVLDGYELARRVRAQLGAESPRLVAVTGWGSEDDRQRAREVGFDAHLVKPARPRELRRALRRQADGNHDEQRIEEQAAPPPELEEGLRNERDGWPRP